MASAVNRYRQRPVNYNDSEANARQNGARHDNFFNGNQSHDKLSKGTPLDNILDRCRKPPQVSKMENVKDSKYLFMIMPFEYDRSSPNDCPRAINDVKGYVDRWDEDHVRMPCSPRFVDKNKKPIWPKICDWLRQLREKCNKNTASIEDLKMTIEKCSGHHYDMNSLEVLIDQTYASGERAYFMSKVLSNICSLAIHVDAICSAPPPLLRTQKGQSLTMSQRQAASLLACAFFCLFPYRSESDRDKEYEKFPNPNFNRLYQSGSPEKIEKLRCILYYFQRVHEKMPTGVISFRRSILKKDSIPKWSTSQADLCDIHITADKKIEDVDCALQVDFANKYIGGGVLGNGCVQEEIRFSLCPEMLVSLLICEVMEPNECIFLIGCERFSKYEGYAESFKFAGNHVDEAHKDNWGRKWCHLVAIDAIFFRDRTVQYEMESVKRELIKAFVGFRPRPTQTGAENLFGISTGHWGCGAFNGDKQLKAIIQLTAASEAQRPLIYAAYRDNNFVNAFAAVYEFLKCQNATVSDLYRYLDLYSSKHTRGSLFDYILQNPISRHKPK